MSEELGRHCATTALTFNMHTATTILVGQIADDLDLTPAERSLLAERRTELRRAIVENGTIHNVVCLVPGDERIRFMGVPADAPGATIDGEWDPLGMRGTDARTLVLDDAVVPTGNEWLPPSTFDQAAARWPYFYVTLSFACRGLMRGVLDATGAYLRGEGRGSSGPARRDHPIKQQGWAQMNLLYDRAQSLTYRVLAECGVDPSSDQVRRAWSSVVTVMEGAPAVGGIFWGQTFTVSRPGEPQ